MQSSTAVQDQSGGNESDSILPSRSQTSLDMGVPSPMSIQLKEQITPADEYALKVRKPYTITKQRERWTDEEHIKFLEALKLYGRAWRRIEDHVGTKTAVQIRSHAQKFFSKVVRESNNGDISSVKPIEIPPPRPKRKPVHPYPRKLATPVKSGTSAPDLLSVSEQENQSPVSVLSALGSDALCTTDPTKPNASPSPVSSAIGGKFGGFVHFEPPNFSLEESISSPSQANASSNPDNQACVKLEPCTQDYAFVKEGSVEASSTQCLKLFGKTVLISDSHRASSTSYETCKTPLTDVNDEATLQTLPWNFNFSASDLECASNALALGTPSTFYYMPPQNETLTHKDSVSSTLLSRGASHASVSFPCTRVHNPIPRKGRPLFNDIKLEDKKFRQEGSSTSSHTELVSGEKGEAHSSGSQLEQVRRDLSHPRPSKTPSLEQRASFAKRVKGFVPYKRCLAERDGNSSVLTGYEREEQRTRLCL